jgi:hypothetical protein
MKASGESLSPEFLQKVATIILGMRKKLQDEEAKQKELLVSLRLALKVTPSSEQSSRQRKREKLKNPPSDPSQDPKESLPPKKKSKKHDDAVQCRRVMRRISVALAEHARKKRMKKKKQDEKLEIFDDKDVMDDFYDGMPADFGRIENSSEDEYSAKIDEALKLGTEKGPDPELSRTAENVLAGAIASEGKETRTLEVDKASIPAGSERGLRRDYEKTKRMDLNIEVREIECIVESVSNPMAGFRARASTEPIGPSDHSVTWRAVINVILLVVGHAFPMRRVERLTGGKFSCSRICKYLDTTSERGLPVYLHMLGDLANVKLIGGDSCVASVHEWTRILEAGVIPKDFPSGRLSQEIDKVFPFVGRKRQNPEEPKSALHTTILTGRTNPKDPTSLLVVYRTHTGDVGDLLTAILPKRSVRRTVRRSSARLGWRTCKRQRRRLLMPLTVQGDLSPANRVVNKTVLARVRISYAGCLAHLRRPFVRFRDQDPEFCDQIVELLDSIFAFERQLDQVGRNRQNVRAIRLGFEALILWTIRHICKPYLQKWSSSRPLGKAIRYLDHWAELTAYLRDPTLDATNNLREKLLRYEKLADSSSFGRDAVEGRARYDILRSLVATSIATGAPVGSYFLFLHLADLDDIKSRPHAFTPHAYAQCLRTYPTIPDDKLDGLLLLAKKSVEYLKPNNATPSQEAT